MTDDKMKDNDVFLLGCGETDRHDLLTDEAHLSSVLRRLVEAIAMRAINEPIVTKAESNPGLEGYIPIDLSNITISTYLNPSRVVFCIHSCTRFETRTVIELIAQAYETEQIRSLSCSDVDFV